MHRAALELPIDRSNPLHDVSTSPGLAQTEGLAAVELRGIWLEVNPETMWRDSVRALLVGFADSTTPSARG